MSSEVWNIALQTSAKDTYEINNNKLSLNMLGKTFTVNNLSTQLYSLEQLTSVCKEMIVSFDDIEDDQNQYLIEIENLENEYGIVKENIDERISKLIAEMKVLEAKEQNGTITEEEQKELDNKRGELSELFKTSDKECAEVNSELAAKKEKLSEKFLAKQNIAEDYGKCAIEKGTPYAENDVEVSDEDRKLIDTGYKFILCLQGKYSKIVGLEAVETGTELLDKVSDSEKKLNSVSNKKAKKLIHKSV